MEEIHELFDDGSNSFSEYHIIARNAPCRTFSRHGVHFDLLLLHSAKPNRVLFGSGETQVSEEPKGYLAYSPTGHVQVRPPPGTPDSYRTLYGFRVIILDGYYLVWGAWGGAGGPAKTESKSPLWGKAKQSQFLGPWVESWRDILGPEKVY